MTGFAVARVAVAVAVAVAVVVEECSGGFCACFQIVPDGAGECLLP